MYVSLNGKTLVARVVKRQKKEKAVVTQPVHHVYVIDVSGSMSSDLPKLRDHVKTRLPKSLGERDLLSIIWFSGKNEFGVILELESVTGLMDLARVNGLIDRWLKPVGMTGFLQPLELAQKVFSKTPAGYVNSLVFMSDGQDNQWTRETIYKAADAVAPLLSACTIVEYGYYADRVTLSEMASRMRGVQLFADGFNSYEPIIDAAIARGRKADSSELVSVEVRDALYDLAYTVSPSGDVTVYNVVDGHVSVRGDVDKVYCVAQKSSGDKAKVPDFLPALYAGLVVFGTRMKSDAVYALLSGIEDARFNELYSNCFGKQKYTEFCELARKAVTDATERFVSGTGEIPKVDKKAPTVLDFLSELSERSRNVCLRVEDLEYSRISRAQEDAVSADVTGEVKLISEEIAKTREKKKLAELQGRLNDLLQQGKFVPNDKLAQVTDLVFNEDRANVSLQTLRHGKVKFALPGSNGELTTFDTVIFRNYALVKDGMLNVKTLPLYAHCDGEFSKFVEEKKRDKHYVGVFTPNMSPHLNGWHVIDVHLDKLPLVNRARVEDLSAKELFETDFLASKFRAHQKVYKNALDKFGEEAKIAARDVLGESAGGVVNEQFKRLSLESRAWLKEKGLTEASYSQKSVAAALSGDTYPSKELTVSIESLSTIPKVEDAIKRIKEGGKLTPSMQLMVEAIEWVEKNNTPVRLAEKLAQTKATVKALLTALASAKYTAIIAQTYFKEFATVEEDTLTLELGGVQRKCTVKMLEKEVKI